MYVRMYASLPLSLCLSLYRLVGLVVKASASTVEDPGLDYRFRRGNFSRSSHTSDLKIDTSVATLPGPGIIG